MPQPTLTPNNWTLNAYTNATWTPLVDEASQIVTIIAANSTGSGPIDVQMRLSDGTNELAVIVPTTSVAQGETHTVDIRSLNILDGQVLEIFCDEQGATFLASGVTVTEPA